MFDKLNIFINNEKEEKPKSFLLEIFSNKHELAIITFVIYFTGVIYQILKLIGGFTVSPILGNLYFFSFSNSLNDFSIIFGYTLIIFILSFLLVFSPNYLLDKFVYLKNRSKIFIGFWFSIIFLLLLWLMYYVNNTIFKGGIYIYVILPYLISIILTIFILTNKGISKNLFYVFSGLFFIYGFVAMLYGSGKYYGCLNVMKNTDKDCILFEYKNDKYGFTGKGDIYNLDEFKSFYTSDYFKNQSNSGSVKK